MVGLLIFLFLTFGFCWCLTELLWNPMVRFLNWVMFGKWQERHGYPMLEMLNEMEDRKNAKT